MGKLRVELIRPRLTPVPWRHLQNNPEFARTTLKIDKMAFLRSPSDPNSRHMETQTKGGHVRHIITLVKTMSGHNFHTQCTQQKAVGTAHHQLLEPPKHPAHVQVPRTPFLQLRHHTHG